MKINTNVRPHASAMILTLLTATIVGISLASYFSFVSHQNLSVARSLAWNGTVPVMESGVEEALTQIHYNGYTNLSANSWTLGGDGLYHKIRSVAGGTYCEIAIQPVDPPVIYSTGYTPAPLAPSSQLGMVLGAITAPTPNPYVKRRVRVTTQVDTLTHGAMVAKGSIDFSGNNVTTDSFDSSNPLYNTGGQYDATKSKDNGDVRTNGKTAGVFDAGNADIKGHVATGPGGTVTVGSNASIGDSAWVNAGTSGVESGWSSDDMNVDIQDVNEPFTSGYSTPTGGKVGKTRYAYLLDQSDTNYKLNSFGGKVLVTGTNVTLWVTDSVSFGTDEYIQIQPGASLKLYVSAPTATIGGNGVINGNGDAKSFEYYGLPSNTSLVFSGNAAFTGIIYAPEADFKLGGGGSNPYDFVGAAVVNTVKMNGHFHFHYDEALRNLVPSGYVVASWNEIDPNGPLH